MTNKKTHTPYIYCAKKNIFFIPHHTTIHTTIHITPYKHTPRVKTRQRHVSQQHVSQQHISQRHISQRHVSQRHISQQHVSQQHVSQQHISSSSPTIIRDKRQAENKKRQAISRPPAKIILSLKQIHIINAHIIYLLYNNIFFTYPRQGEAQRVSHIARLGIFCREEIKKSSRRILQNIGRKRFGEYINK